MSGTPEPRWTRPWQYQTAALSEVSTWPDACALKFPHTCTRSPLRYSEFDSNSVCRQKERGVFFPKRKMQQRPKQILQIPDHILIWLHAAIWCTCNTVCLHTYFLWVYSNCLSYYSEIFFLYFWKFLLSNGTKKQKNNIPWREKRKKKQTQKLNK